MPTAPNRPRNSRTANGLKRGVRIEWDTPKPKRKPEPKFDPIKFLSDCGNDADAYSDRERTAFRKVLARMQELEAEVAAYRDTEWDNHTNGAD
jgi:hypothetical protein